MSDVVLGGLVGAILGMLAAEVLDLSAWASPRIVKLAARRMPTPELRQRYEAEWGAELAAFEGLKLIKLAKSVAILWGSFKTAAAYRPEETLNLFGYASRVRKMFPLVLQYAWQGRDVGLPAGLVIHFVVIGMLNENPDVTFGDSKTTDGRVPVIIDADVEMTKPTYVADKLVGSTILPLLMLHAWRASGSIKIGIMTVRDSKHKRTVKAVPDS